MAVKKSELYSSLWKLCDELRGGMDASQYKDYVLVLLFMKYVSDKAASRRDYLLEVPPGARFEDMVAAKNQKDIGDRINKIIAKLADANPSLRGAIDVANFNDPDKLGKAQEMVDRLTKLIGIFQNPALDFRSNTAEGDDLLGDAYEYLMRNFATESGKSKGQFYTPAEVSRIMAQVAGITAATSNQQSIYDPTCGSGSLLLKAHASAKSATSFDLAIYGQEMDNATAALARMNMVLHDAETAEIWQDNTLARPHWTEGPHELKRFDFVVANPPFSQKAWTTGFDPTNDDFGRFPYGLPPAKNGDYAFLLHMLASLKSTGSAAVILPHGVLFRSNAEATIRKALVSRGFIKGLIGLPPNLFYGTGIPACIVVLDKAGAADRRDVFMIDASRGFRKDGAKNRLRDQDIHRIIDAFTRCVESDRYSRRVPLGEIEANAFNLNLTRYIDSSDPDDVHDIGAHLRGGIPDQDLEALNAHWAVFPALRASLFQPSDLPGYSAPVTTMEEIGPTVRGHAEFKAFDDSARRAYETWQEPWHARLHAFGVGENPRHLLGEMSETLLGVFPTGGLVDPYRVYQHLMDYWTRSLQDDLYLVAQVGWSDAARPRLLVDVDGKKSKELHDFTVGSQRFKSDLLPARLLIARFFSNEAQRIVSGQSEVDRLEAELELLAEEHGGDEGLLEDVVDDKGRLVSRLVGARLREIGADADFTDERTLLERANSLAASLSKAKAEVKAAGLDLDRKLAAKYGEVDEAQVREIVVNAKWLADMARFVDLELDTVADQLTSRLAQLLRRYVTPLHVLAAASNEATSCVERDLRALGFQWN